MKTAIKKAWEENLKLNVEAQYTSKEAIIEDLCPCGGKYSLNVELEQPVYCTDGEDEEICIRCWNRKVEEDKDDEIQDNKLTFEQLEKSPIDGIGLDDSCEKNLKHSLKRNQDLIYTGSNINITYEKIPKLVAWLQSVYNYCTELRDKIEYVDFETAKKWMYDNNGVAECNGTLYDITSSFTIEVIDSAKWALIKGGEE